VSKVLTVGQLRRALDNLPGTLPLDDLPIVIAGGGQKVVGAEVIYQAEFFDFSYLAESLDERVGDSFEPVAVILQVVAA